MVDYRNYHRSLARERRSQHAPQRVLKWWIGQPVTVGCQKGLKFGRASAKPMYLVGTKKDRADLHLELVACDF